VCYVGHQRNVDDWISLSDLVVLPSYREGVPRTLLEAAAMGKPIVTTDVPGCREVVVDGVNGLLVPPRNVSKLADAIQGLLSDPQRREKMGEAGRRIAVEEFSAEKVVASYMKIYRDVMEER
jgi:glycosyltransferase involved in cell wall biosynthesis